MAGNLLLRTLTVKSILETGKYAGQKVGTILEVDKNYLRWVYYRQAKLSFTEDILNQLSIVGEFVIQKPSINDEVYHKLNIILNSQLTDEERLDKYVQKKRIDNTEKKLYNIRCERDQIIKLGKSNLQAINHSKGKYSKLTTMKYYI